MNIETADDILRWYVIQTQPKQEQRAESNLRAWMVETFFPKLKESRYNPYVSKPTYTIKPLFPSYIFARFRASQLLHKVYFTRGVRRIVSFGNGPVSIEDEALQIIKANIQEDGFVRFKDDLKTGDKVKVNDGPLKNLSGIFERETKAAERVSILLMTTGYQGHLEIDRSLIAKINS
jgi:transcriptional antiterminator RfaH